MAEKNRKIEEEALQKKQPKDVREMAGLKGQCALTQQPGEPYHKKCTRESSNIP
jgi:hypothetical protein